MPLAVKVSSQTPFVIYNKYTLPQLNVNKYYHNTGLRVDSGSTRATQALQRQPHRRSDICRNPPRRVPNSEPRPSSRAPCRVPSSPTDRGLWVGALVGAGSGHVRLSRTPPKGTGRTGRQIPRKAHTPDFSRVRAARQSPGSLPSLQRPLDLVEWLSCVSIGAPSSMSEFQ